MEHRTPHHGEVYRSPEGRPALYVRTEKRPGDTEPHHLFVETQNRVVFSRWVPGGPELPEALELIAETDAPSRVAELEAELVGLEAEVDALAAALRVAVGVVPVPVANDLRGRYKAALRESLTARAISRRSRVR